jgi:sorbitol-specific phosphotransferase system component IIBC
MNERLQQPDPEIPAPTVEKSSLTPEERKRIVLIVISLVVVIALVVVGVVLLLQAGGDTTGMVRDIFIIFMALESLIIGVALVIMIIQLSVLINLIQNEIKPILNATIGTVNTLRGTTEFISDNLAEPVIRLNE